MQWKNSETRYGAIHKTLHWTMGLLIIALLAIGLYMSEFEVRELYPLHKSLGVLVLGLVIVRILWRISTKVPALPSTIDRNHALLAHAMHFALYIAMVTMPLSGWIMSSAAGYPASFFGLFALPDLVEKNPELRMIAGDIHEMAADLLMIMLALHILAALLHHFHYKNDILKRMLPLLK